MHLGDGYYLVAELPIEHLAIYSEGHRLELFNKKGTSCVCCGNAGIHLAVVEGKSGSHRSIKLFTDEWIAMTIDHIKPKAHGGEDSIDNYQPLCQWCNAIKSDRKISTEELRELIRYNYRNIRS